MVETAVRQLPARPRRPGLLGATPLLALDAVVMDTETTGLDPAKARLLEFASLEVTAGHANFDDVFVQRVKPDVPIPPQTTAIHGIRQDDVADAPPFAAVGAALMGHLSGQIVIGHNIGFDIALLKGECERNNIPFRAPRSLDVRLLAEIAAPQLAGYTLEKLAAWLDVEITGRHTAAGDVLATAAIFFALLPSLRKRNIRTLAEAEKACRQLTNILEGHHQAGWAEAASHSRLEKGNILATIDSFAYRHRVRELMSAPVLYCAPDDTLKQALDVMIGNRVSSLYVRERGEGPVLPEKTSIITERDILRAIAAEGEAGFTTPVKAVASGPLTTVQADAYAYRAIGRMSRLNIRHLGVTDEAGHLVGALSARDLLRLRAQEAVNLGDEIDVAIHSADLARAWGQLATVAVGLRAEDIRPITVAGVVSRELGALTRQAAVIAESRLVREGRGPAPCKYCVGVLGSAGRGESLLAMDQDNCLIFETGEEGGPEDEWFARLGRHIADILHEAGVPYCTGGVMASEPAWRGSLDTWEKRIVHWTKAPKPQDLLNVDIFFDLRPVHGEMPLANVLRQKAYAAAHHNFTFAKLLAEAMGEPSSPFTMMGGFRLEDGRLDLKHTGLFAIVSVARILAITHHITARDTQGRLKGFIERGIGGGQDLAALMAAHETVVGAILDQQLADLAAGLPPSNKVAVKNLPATRQEELRAALRTARDLPTLLRDLLFAG